MATSPTLFHLAFPVSDMDSTKSFYVDKLGCRLGRRTKTSMVLNFYGNQLVAQLTKEPLPAPKSIYPRHYGLIFLEHSQWLAFSKGCQEKDITVFLEPCRRHKGELTEHETMFIADPSGNLLEFKYYFHTQAIFEPLDGSLIGGDRDGSTSDS